MKTVQTQAIVLRRTDYGEADKIIHLLTPKGRFNVIARGVRREKSKLAGGVDLFSLSDVVIREGRGELGILMSVRLKRFFRHILEDYDRMQFGYDAIKLTASASEFVDEPEWFGVLEQVFVGLDENTIDIRLVKTWFYLHHAALLGHGLGLYYDCRGDRLNPKKLYTYDVDEKGLRPSDKGEIGADHIKLLRLVAQKPLLAVAQIGGTADVLSACFSIAREHAAV